MSPAEEHAPPAIDTTKASLARVYDALLGGKDNFTVDRELRERLVEVNPELPDIARHNRRWLERVVRWLADEREIDQFLDVGSGLPTAENTHQVAQRVDPAATVVYVDNDPAVIAHGCALLAENDQTRFAPGDLTRPHEILDDATVTSHLDLDRPVALLQLLTLHQVPDEANPEQIMATYVERLASGSYVALTHARKPEPDDANYERFVEATVRFREASSGFTPRTHDGISSLLRGLELVEPGVVGVDDWWPEGPRTDALPYFVHFLAAAVARKP